MKKRTIVILLVITLLLFTIVSLALFNQFYNESANLSSLPGDRTSRMGMRRNMMNMGGEANTELVVSNEEAKQLALSALLEGKPSPDGSISYNITEQEGSTQIKAGSLTQTYGYNGPFLGPVIRIHKGQKVKIQTVNNLDADTSFHWHGLKVPSNVDGGPHTPIKPGISAELSFTVKQEAATLWFHPHPVGETGEQVYKGLAGLIYIEDEHSDTLSLPREYGVNDFPLTVQDRLFDSNNQLDYASAYNADGISGDTLLINGTINPFIAVKNEKVRLRLLNDSNARNYQFQFSDGSSFKMRKFVCDCSMVPMPVTINFSSQMAAPSIRLLQMADF